LYPQKAFSQGKNSNSALFKIDLKESIEKISFLFE
jgi:hypothetical protein